MAEAVTAARAEAPQRPVIILGHSLGAQLAVGHQLGHTPADGVVTVGGALPYHRHYPLGGLPLVIQAGVVVPLLTALFGHLPKPAFGGPGARTLMREWARMALTGRTPFPAPEPVRTPSLLVALGIGAGLLGALALSRALASLLFALSPYDPLTLAGVAALLAAVALFASDLPARRATRIDPLAALRAE